MTDKHGLVRFGYNLQLDIDFQGDVLKLGLNDSQLPCRTADDTSARFISKEVTPIHSTAEQIDDLSKLLKKGPKKTIVEE